MTHRLNHRLRRLEHLTREDPAVRRVHSRQVLLIRTLIGKAQLADMPDLAHVIPGDTDPQTWQAIEETLALARGGEAPLELDAPVERYRTPGEYRAAIERLGIRAAEQTRRVDAAVRSARRRLAHV